MNTFLTFCHVFTVELVAIKYLFFYFPKICTYVPVVDL